MDSTGTRWYRSRTGNQGGALYAQAAGPATLRDCEFWYNDAVHAGAVVLFSSTIELFNPLFVGNYALGNGGGTIFGAGDFGLFNATVVGNIASHHGGYDGSGLYLGANGTVANAVV